ncbi:helix-turn-helix domain-containing protein [Robertmurraya sp. FSL R5-0851]|uniref:helix-turn-helix domain-containing protein n=1 Tax=Robertmurraya sp. FSL R5-0851 TaxID=2921584 RepID=UPI0030F8F04D
MVKASAFELECKVLTEKELTQRKQSLLRSLRMLERETFFQKIEEFNCSMIEQKLDPEVVKGKMLRLIYLSMEVAKESLWNKGYLPHMEVANLHSTIDLCYWFQQQMEQIFQCVKNNQVEPKHIAIESALRFIQSNYDKELSLQEVSDHSNMSSTYFSVLFKEQMGESYIKYVTKLRIEHAKKLLMNGAKVNEVSEKVGYYNYRHFSELFKRHVGMTPGHYRDRQSHA